jgi:hypothetical protein
MWHQVKMTIALRCNFHPLFMQLASNLCGMVIYDWFIQLKWVMAYVYVALSFVNNFMIKCVNTKHLKFLTIIMLICDNLQVEQMAPCGLS